VLKSIYSHQVILVLGYLYVVLYVCSVRILRSDDCTNLSLSYRVPRLPATRVRAIARTQTSELQLSGVSVSFTSNSNVDKRMQAQGPSISVSRC